MEKRYPEYLDHLRSLTSKLEGEQPGVLPAFGQLHQKSMAVSALSAKVKELMR